MTRVLQAMAGAAHGGAEAFFERLVIALHNSGLEQRAVIRRDPQRATRLRAAGLDVVELPFGGRLDLATRYGFRAAIRDRRPDVVLTWMNRATLFCPRGDFVHAARLGGYYDLKYYRRCRHLIGNTRGIVRWLVEQGWPAERAHYLPNFVTAAPAAPAAPVPRQTLNTPERAPLLLAMGRLHVNKGFDVLLCALAELPEAWLWLAGEGPLRGELESLTGRLGLAERVRFLGWRDDVAALMAAADLFVCPSRHEPLGNVVLDAWAHRRPVVAAAGQGPSELIADGEHGLLVPIDDAPALAATIRRALDDPALAGGLAESGRRAYERDFTEAAVVAAYRAFFETVAG